MLIDAVPVDNDGNQSGDDVNSYGDRVTDDTIGLLGLGTEVESGATERVPVAVAPQNLSTNVTVNEVQR